MENVFAQPNKLIKIIFDTYYKDITKFEEVLPEDILGVSSYEISSNTIDAEPLDIWRLEIFVGDNFDIESIIELLKKFSQNANVEIIEEVRQEIIQDKDWILEYQKNQKPLIIKNFYISNKELLQNCPKQQIPICIEASRAFGTGDHETTEGCVRMMYSIRNENIQTIFDVGTGTGILAFVAEKIWKEAEIYASDIDIVAIEVAKSNGLLNNSHVKFFQNNPEIILPLSAPSHFDLIVSNILAGPLEQLASFFRSISKSNTTIILSGFLDNQFEHLKQVYEKESFCFINKTVTNNWVAAKFKVKVD